MFSFQLAALSTSQYVVILVPGAVALGAISALGYYVHRRRPRK